MRFRTSDIGTRSRDFSYCKYQGICATDTDIRIYDGSCLLAETRVSRYGTWMQEVELADKGDPSDHWLYAKLADEEGNELAWQTMVTYDSMYPVINRITRAVFPVC